MNVPNRFYRILAVSGLLSGCVLALPPALPSATEAISVADPAILAAHTAAVSIPALAPHRVDLSQALSDLDVALLAVVGNRDLRAARARQSVADAQVFSAGLLPDLQIGASLDRPIPPGFVTPGALRWASTWRLSSDARAHVSKRNGRRVRCTTTLRGRNG